MKDLAEVSLELLINSLEAQANALEFTLDLGHDPCVLSLIDNGKGMDEALLAKVTSPFTSTRVTRSTGFGLAFFQQAIQQANGQVNIFSKPNQGTRILATWDGHHLDALPLGNMGETLALVLQRQPHLHLNFHITKHARSYHFSSDECALALEPVSLDEPSVQQWIIDTVQAHCRMVEGAV